MSVPVAKVKKPRVKKLPVPKAAEESVQGLVEKKFWLKVEEDPDLKTWLEKCDKVFFDGKLTGRVEIRWNGQMVTSSGLTKYKRNRKTGEVVYCRVLLSSPLLKSNVANSNQFIRTLLHELIHAYIAVEERLPKRECNKGHGPRFLSHMDRINRITGLEISVYHHLYSQMHAARPYWWACDGPCRLWPPYHGLIKKRNQGELTVMDLTHHKGCPGTFHRIQVPDSTQAISKEPKKTSVAAARPTLLVRRSLVLPSPYTRRDIHVCSKKRIVPASPRTAKAYYQQFIRLGAKVPKTALVSTSCPKPASSIVTAQKPSQPTVGVKPNSSSKAPILGGKPQHVTISKDKTTSTSAVAIHKPSLPTVGLKPSSSSSAPVLGDKSQHATVSNETTKSKSTALKKVPVITLDTTPKKRNENEPPRAPAKVKTKIPKGRRIVPVQTTRILDETICID